jgi:hypothetical protein
LLSPCPNKKKKKNNEPRSTVTDRVHARICRLIPTSQAPLWFACVLNAQLAATDRLARRIHARLPLELRSQKMTALAASVVKSVLGEGSVFSPGPADVLSLPPREEENADEDEGDHDAEESQTLLEQALKDSLAATAKFGKAVRNLGMLDVAQAGYGHALQQALVHRISSAERDYTAGGLLASELIWMGSVIAPVLVSLIDGQGEVPLLWLSSSSLILFPRSFNLSHKN